MTFVTKHAISIFREVLLRISDESTEAWVYLPMDKKNWNLDSICAVLESEEVPPELEGDPDAEIPQFAKSNNLIQVLPVTSVQDIILNLREQTTAPSLEDMFSAFIYYHNNDAFIVLK